MSVVLVKNYSKPPVNEKEILRYAGCSQITDEISKLLEECLAEVDDALSYKVCYAIFDKSGKSNSAALENNLNGCSRVVLFAATIGLPMDRLIMKYSRISPSKALLLQAYGAERIESLCDMFCNDIKNELGVELKPRFSPGYGDFPLEVQKEIFKVLDCPRKIGLTLNERLLMTPTKSVTGIIGIKDEY